MFVELHMIQNFVPSNLNRDDAGNPKDCEFGGYRRARISSQCIKRAIRTHPLFEQTTQVENGTRTKLLAGWERLRDPLLEARKPEEEVAAVALRFAKAYAQNMDSKDETKTAILVYISPEEVQEAAQALLDNWDNVLPTTKAADKAIASIAKRLLGKYEKITSAPDIALFGRMLAIKPSAKILDAACQVAHAISTHAVAMEMDFFTAVDDISEESGAGMMDYTGFNSACFYRYARIDWGQLVKNLNDDADLARRAVEGFLRAAVAAVPSGMKNAWAQNNPPSFLLAVVREDGMGWSLANAFVRPVRPTYDDDLVTASVKALGKYWDRLCTVFGSDTLKRIAALPLDPQLELTTLAEHVKPNRKAWIEAILNALLAEEEAA